MTGEPQLKEDQKSLTHDNVRWDDSFSGLKSRTTYMGGMALCMDASLILYLNKSYISRFIL